MICAKALSGCCHIRLSMACNCRVCRDAKFCVSTVAELSPHAAKAANNIKNAMERTHFMPAKVGIFAKRHVEKRKTKQWRFFFLHCLMSLSKHCFFF